MPRYRFQLEVEIDDGYADAVARSVMAELRQVVGGSFDPPVLPETRIVREVVAPWKQCDVLQLTGPKS